MLIAYATLLLVIVQYCFSNSTPCGGLINKRKNDKRAPSYIDIPKRFTHRFQKTFEADQGLLSANGKFCLVSNSHANLSIWSTLKNSAPVFTIHASSDENKNKLVFQLEKNNTLKVAYGASLVFTKPYQWETLVGVSIRLDDYGALRICAPDSTIIFDTRPSCDGLLQEAEERQNVKSYIDIEVPGPGYESEKFNFSVNDGLLSQGGQFCSFITYRGLEVLSSAKSNSSKDLLRPWNNRENHLEVYLFNEKDTDVVVLFIGPQKSTIEGPVLSGVKKARLFLDDDGELKLLANSSVVWSSHGVRQPVRVTTHEVEFEELCHVIPSRKDILRRNNSVWDNKSVVSPNGNCTFGYQGKDLCGIKCDNFAQILIDRQCAGVELINCQLQFILRNKSMITYGLGNQTPCYLQLNDNGKIKLHRETDGRVMWPPAEESR